jgi:hypothetical protein
VAVRDRQQHPFRAKGFSSIAWARLMNGASLLACPPATVWPTSVSSDPTTGLLKSMMVIK